MKNTLSATPSDPVRDFFLRTYYKSELAQLYMPHVSPRSALRTWNNWIHKHPTLLRELQHTGYQKCDKILSPAQVQLIVNALGVP